MCLPLTGEPTSLTPASGLALSTSLPAAPSGATGKSTRSLPVSRSLIPQLCTNDKQAPGEGEDVSAASVFQASLPLL